MRIARHVERELAAEATDAGHQTLHALDGGVTGADVDARSGVRCPAVGAPTLPHRAQTPGSAAWYAGDSGRVVSSTGVDVGTAVG
jgi:hypothetical protein